MADVNDLAGKMFKMSTTGRAPAPEVLAEAAAAERMDVQTHQPRDDIYDAQNELINQAKKIKRMHNLLDRYSTSLDAFIKKVEQNEVLAIYAYAVLPPQLKNFKQHYVTSIKSSLEELESYPGKLIQELYNMPKQSLEQIEEARKLSASHVKSTRRGTLNETFSSLNFLPGQLLIRALGPTVTRILYKPQVIDEQQWMKVVGAFKRTFPNYKFTPIEMKYLNEWLHTGAYSFYGKKGFALKPADSAQLKAALIQSFGNDAEPYLGKSPLMEWSSPLASPDDDGDEYNY